MDFCLLIFTVFVLCCLLCSVYACVCKCLCFFVCFSIRRENFKQLFFFLLYFVLFSRLFHFYIENRYCRIFLLFLNVVIRISFIFVLFFFFLPSCRYEMRSWFVFIFLPCFFLFNLFFTSNKLSTSFFKSSFHFSY